MQPFALAHAEGNDLDSLVGQLIGQLQASSSAHRATGEGSSPLALLYVTDQLADRAAELHAQLARETGISAWVGTVGMGICASGVEYFDTPAAAVLVTDYQAKDYQLIDIEEPTEIDLDASQAVFGILHADPRSPDVESAIERICASMQVGFVVGGLASSRSAYVQFAAAPHAHACSGVLLSAGAEVQTRLTQGCSPVGPRHRVTRVREGLVLELDGSPALDVFGADVSAALGDDTARLIQSCAFVGLPIAGSDRGDYLVRNLVGVEPDQRALAVGHELKEGDELFFCRRDRQAALEDLDRMLDELLRAAGTRGAKGALYVSCLARGPNLFGPDSAELKQLQDKLGDLPLVGFFANGEFSHDRVYGYTGVLTLFF